MRSTDAPTVRRGGPRSRPASADASSVPSWRFAALFLAAALFAPGGDVVAGIAVSPLQQEVTVRPGAKAEIRLTLRNVKRRPDAGAQALKIDVVGFSVSREGHISFAGARQHARSADKWITLEADELVLAPGESREIKGTVEAPFSADGDYWAALMVSNEGTSRRQGAVNIRLRTACGVFVRVARHSHLERLSIRDLSVALPRSAQGAAPAAGHAGQLAAGPTEEISALVVSADVTNEGLVKVNAWGTASLYLDGRRKVATIPLHAHRRRILPGHARRFVGVMPSPLPAGDYSVKLMFGSNPKGGRRAFKEVAFELDGRTAALWRDSNSGHRPASFDVEPQELKQEMTAGRFTALSVSILNRSPATMQLSCRLNEGTLPAGWLQISPADFTLGPGQRRSAVCRIAIPDGTQPGNYSGRLVIGAESAGLGSEENAPRREVPIRIAIAE